MEKHAKIYVAGHRGMVGSAICRELRAQGYEHVVTRTRADLNLLDQAAVNAFMAVEKPDYVFIAAAKVGGINANNVYRADFIYENLMIEANLINAAHTVGVDRLCFLGSSCIYPKEAPQPISEKDLLTGPLEQTNEPYAIAKIAGIKLCESYNLQYGRHYFSVMPCNLYGPNDNYDLQNSHVLPALIRKIHDAKVARNDVVTIWGTGTPRREFLYVDDLAKACIMLMQQGCNEALLNVGSGEDISIYDLTRLVMKVVGLDGQIQCDQSMPDGTMRKLLNVSKIRECGWLPKVSLEEGIGQAYEDMLSRLYA